jgi:hypothetical protein
MKNCFFNPIFTPIPDMSKIYSGTRVEGELPGMLDFLKLWGSNATKLWAVHIALGVIATFFSLLTAAGIASIGTGYSQVFAFIAALSISMMTAFNLGAKSNNTRNAWRKLNSAVMKFNQSIVKKEDVIKAYEEGESLIGGVSFSQGGIQDDELSKEEDTTEEKDPTQPTKTGGSPTIK